jgi:ParB-like chromosome segregation protein Spo0J
MHISIENILIDENLYPRNQVYWKHTQALMGALKAGSTLPPIVVGKRDGRYIVIDGRHRYECHRRLKRAKIAAMVTHLEEPQWFAEAVRLNSAHGHGLSYQEKLSASMILQRAKYPPNEIAKIVHIPLESLRQAIEQRGTWVSPEDIKPVVAKATLAKEAERKGRQWLETAAAGGLDDEQKILSGASFERLAEELLVLLGDEHLDAEDENVVRLILSLNASINQWMAKHLKAEQNVA